MTSEISKILDKPGIEMVEEREKQNRKRFEKRYKNVLLRTPDRPETQIQYFAGIMSEFLPVIFHSEWKNRFDAYMDFSEFYLSEFDDAYCLYLKENQEYEKKYPFQFSPLGANALEKKTAKLSSADNNIIFYNKQQGKSRKHPVAGMPIVRIVAQFE